MSVKVKDVCGLEFLVNSGSVHAGKFGLCYEQTVRDGVVMVLLDLDDITTWFYIHEVTQL